MNDVTPALPSHQALQIGLIPRFMLGEGAYLAVALTN